VAAAESRKRQKSRNGEAGESAIPPLLSLCLSPAFPQLATRQKVYQ